MQADFADRCDSLHLPRMLTSLPQRLRTHDLPLRELLADVGYANDSNYALPRPLLADIRRAWRRNRHPKAYLGAREVAT